MTTLQAVELLRPFIGPIDGSVRYRLDEVFSRGGFLYATDTKIAVRVPTATEPESEATNYPDAGNVPAWSLFPLGHDAKPLPPRPEPEWTQCPKCEHSFEVDDFKRVAIDGQDFALWLLRKIHALPGAIHRKLVYRVIGGKEPKMLFESGELQGILMALKGQS